MTTEPKSCLITAVYAARKWGDYMVIISIVFALLIINNAVKIEKLEERIRRLERR